MIDSTDRIGQRLDHPEQVPAEFQHLIPDDIARVEWILSHEVKGRVLDVGCSDGAISRRIQDTWDVGLVGADFNKAVRWAACWDIREPFKVPSIAIGFDAVYCTEVLEHLFPHESEIALANLWAVLKPGGQLIITVPNRAKEGPHARWDWPDHKQYFLWWLLEQLLRRQFRDVQCRPIVDDIWLGAVCIK